MGRPLKTGLDFFSIDIDMDEDDKIIDLLEDLGSEVGLGSLIYLLIAIYKTGYYIEWNDSVLKKLCRKKHLDKEIIKTSVDYLTGSKLSYANLKDNPTFFDNKLFKEHKILTSKGIQKRYLIACSRREENKFDKRFLLLDYVNEIHLHRKRIKNKYETYNRDGLWILLDNKYYPLSFEVNGILSDNTNLVCVDTNRDNVNTSTQMEKESKEKEKEKKEIKPEYLKLSNLLYSLHKQQDSGYSKTDSHLKKWADSIRLLCERDKRDIRDIERVIIWAKQPGCFWFANIQSGNKLREKFDMLLAQMNRDKKNNKNSTLTKEDIKNKDYSKGWNP